MIPSEKEQALKNRFGIDPAWRCVASSDRTLHSIHDSAWWAGSIPEAIRYPSDEQENASEEQGIEVEYLAAADLLSENVFDCQAPTGYVYLVFGPGDGSRSNVLLMVGLDEIRNA